MKKLLTSIMAVAALTGIQAFAQEADEASFLGKLREDTKCSLIPSSVTINLEYKSRYLSDGRVINPQNMLFGSVDLAWDFATDGIYVGIWGANDLNRYNADSGIKYEPEEFDYYLGYWYEWGDLGDAVKSICLDVSYTYWDYPSRTGWECVGEQQNTFTVDLSCKPGINALSVKPGVAVNWDPENEKIYGKLYVALGKDIEDVKGLSLGSKFELFWGNGHYVKNAFADADGSGDIDKETFTTFIWTVNASFAVNDNISFGPFAALSFAIDHECRDAWKTNDNSKSGVNTLWGFGSTFKF